MNYKIGDKFYNLANFAHVHPGGNVFKNLKNYTDLTPMVYLYHTDMEKIATILPKYEIMGQSLTAESFEFVSDFNYEKYQQLKKIVYNYIGTNNLATKWAPYDWVKNILLFAAYLSIWYYCIFCGAHWFWLIVLGSWNMGFGGLVLHEAAHFAVSKNPKINAILAHILEPFIYVYEWYYEHNYLHHCFTNTTFDMDYYNHKHLLRHDDSFPKMKYMKFQSIYAFFLFLSGSTTNGFLKSIKHRYLPTFLLYLSIFYILGFYRGLIVHFATSVLFLAIAQLSHIQEECVSHTDADRENKKDFLINQVTSTMNYKTDMITRFIVFGLDLQIEHHLFPSLPHRTIRQIQPVVKKYCKENDIRYIEKDNILVMFYKYVKYMHKIGNM